MPIKSHLLKVKIRFRQFSLPLLPTMPWSLLQKWLSVVRLFSGKHTTFSCSHRKSETSPALHETALQHHPELR